jgi:F0F1-type ATP synthase membrane subunit b/b'
VGGFAFIIVAVLLFAKYVLPAVRSAQDAGNADLVSAEQRRDALKAEVSRARAELEAADRDVAAIGQRAAADAARERERLLAEATADGERTVAAAQSELGRARLAATSALRTEFIGRALAAARAKAGSRIDAPTNARLIGTTVDALLGEPVGGHS